ncbi:MAG: hypothetical protein ACTH8F_09585 [Microbacterium sp.]|uniref:hypothetical protein n=1 Tax=Microbacterium sp. TaxID=51671 RepID=UPI003F9852C5
MTQSALSRTTRRLTLLRRSCAALVATFVMVFVTGCALTIPTDPDGTLDSVAGSTLQVGVSPEPGLIELDGEQPSGPLVDLTEEFAESIDARIEWTVAAEESLVGKLENGSIDLAIGGFTDQTPWTDRAGMTRGYKSIEGADQRTLVFLVPLGENAFLATLEAFLDEEVGS